MRACDVSPAIRAIDPRAFFNILDNAAGNVAARSTLWQSEDGDSQARTRRVSAGISVLLEFCRARQGIKDTKM